MEWASYNLALGVGAEKIVEELKHNGFEAGRARSLVTDIQLHPIFKAAKTLGGDVQQWESLSEALLELASQSVDLNSVPRMRGLSSEAFHEHYYSRNLPGSSGVRVASGGYCLRRALSRSDRPGRQGVLLAGSERGENPAPSRSRERLPGAGVGPQALGRLCPDRGRAAVRFAIRRRPISGTSTAIATSIARWATARPGGHSTLLNRWHAELAQRFVDMIPAAEMVAFLRTGSDAVSTAVRLARAITKRRVVLHWGLHG
ncbi:hypothetical protein ACQZ32_18785 [Ralstonia pseudosolanacearum]|uniref:hypothetical protein n=1 Tax=Ralstonia pseudosolanacearum TaxID=1310165 RepID=UPI000AE0B7BB|nr:hypothetical protein [Ralstonia pseudosolanacearum]MDC6285155.1 hypothetical protein [Ralstonia pseudosolanacearum]MDC6293512.1 hypothetical protein [Ralstonia pseudosolanacearum]MDD7788450.1 hypothetical protein [Ralstonia pseudosolanacearum]MDN3369169.1 hypothetical protein [Ralstonia pseudosolanacearum]